MKVLFLLLFKRRFVLIDGMDKRTEYLLNASLEHVVKAGKLELAWRAAAEIAASKPHSDSSHSRLVEIETRLRDFDANEPVGLFEFTKQGAPPAHSELATAPNAVPAQRLQLVPKHG